MAKKDRRKDVIADIFVLLPGRDCGLTHPPSPCGLKKCMLFAEALLNGSRNVYDCPYMKEQQRGSIVLILDEYFR